MSFWEYDIHMQKENQKTQIPPKLKLSSVLTAWTSSRNKIKQLTKRNKKKERKKDFPIIDGVLMTLEGKEKNGVVGGMPCL